MRGSSLAHYAFELNRFAVLGGAWLAEIFQPLNQDSERVRWRVPIELAPPCWR
jgi:hypothetical protein